MKERIRFQDLSYPMRYAIIGGFISLFFFSITMTLYFLGLIFSGD